MLKSYVLNFCTSCRVTRLPTDHYRWDALCISSYIFQCVMIIKISFTVLFKFGYFTTLGIRSCMISSDHEIRLLLHIKTILIHICVSTDNRTRYMTSSGYESCKLPYKYAVLGSVCVLYHVIIGNTNGFINRRDVYQYNIYRYLSLSCVFILTAKSVTMSSVTFHG